MSKQYNIPFSPPRLDEKNVEAVAEVLCSGWVTTGPKTKRFEEELTEYCGHTKTLCVSSATDGLFLALKWFGVRVGDEVIIPAYTYAATANVVIHCGAKPVMVDIGKDFNIDTEKVKQAITNKTKAIIPVDVAGWPCDYDQLSSLLESNEVKTKFESTNSVQELLGRPLLLADAAHSIGAVYKQKKTGTLADITVFSFHAVKNLTTAEGGAICLNLTSDEMNEQAYSWMNTMSLHGQNKDALAKAQNGGWKYDVPEPGYKCNMTDIQAAIGLVELGRYEKETLKRRKEIFALYSNLLSSHSWAQCPVWKNNFGHSACHVYLLRIKGLGEDQRNKIIQYLADKGIATNVHFQPLPLLSYYKNTGYDIADFPLSYSMYENEISLPVFYGLTDEQVEIVVAELAQYIEEVLI